MTTDFLAISTTEKLNSWIGSYENHSKEATKEALNIMLLEVEKINQQWLASDNASNTMAGFLQNNMLLLPEISHNYGDFVKAFDILSIERVTMGFTMGLKYAQALAEQEALTATSKIEEPIL